MAPKAIQTAAAHADAMRDGAGTDLSPAERAEKASYFATNFPQLAATLAAGSSLGSVTGRRAS